MYQVLLGLAFMHKHGYFHRDLKPGKGSLFTVHHSLFTVYCLPLLCSWGSAFMHKHGYFHRDLKPGMTHTL